MRTVVTPHELWRRYRGYSVTGLADEIGFSYTYVSRVESGEKRPSERYLDAVSRVLGVPAAHLFLNGDGGALP